MSIQPKNWFFQTTKTALKPGTRFKTTDQPTETTYKNLIDTSIFKSESDDRAKEDTGSFSPSTAGHVTLATDEQAKTKIAQKPDRSLTVSPSQLPETVGATTMYLQESTSSYTGSMLQIVDDVAITSRSSYKITVVQGFQDFLNSVFDKVSATASSLTNLTTDYTVTKSQVSQNTSAIDSLTAGTFTGLTPVGSRIGFGGSAAPTGWVLLKGDVELDKVAYSALYAVIGDKGGTPVDPSNFVVWRSIWDGAAIGTTSASDDDFSTNGVNSEFLTINHVPDHDHSSGTYGTSSAGNHTHTFSGSGDGSIDNNGSNGRGVWGQNNDRSGTYTGQMLQGGLHNHDVTGHSGNVRGYGQQVALDKKQFTFYTNFIMYHGVI